MYNTTRQEEEYLNQAGRPYYNQGYPGGAMSGPYGQPGYNPQYQNPYPAGGPPPPGWNAQGGQQQGCSSFFWACSAMCCFMGPQVRECEHSITRSICRKELKEIGFMPPPMPHPNMMGMGGNANPHYAEGGEADKYNLQFSDRTIRAAFVRKVFFLVAIMLGVVAVMTAIPFFNHDTRLFVARNMGMYWAAYGVFFAVYLTLMCCESVRRSFPANIIMTAIFTLAVGYMTMMITVHHNVVSVLLTLIICTICCGSIIIFSTQTKYDLTNMMGIMFILSMCLMVFGLVAMISAIFFKVKFIYMVYAALASLLFMFYLAIDVQVRRFIIF
ncbi:hypothetical protein Y032_0188g1160 [Ancylostoma ceylanicum]|uniref:Uncharacterized protein n=2 Tax=Ancylostoma ceylanicum TaxID=53326 RepID=A0A016SRM1_9BILA|nr:hypothetical protein Y032_0188g1160 [Ancylostoma ceylanicum]